MDVDGDELRHRNVESPADANLPASKPPQKCAESESSDGEADEDIDFDEDNLFGQISEEEQRMYRREKAKEWTGEQPPSMRRFIRQAANNIALRIYCDVAVRLPMLKVGKEEVVNMCEQFGAVEYVTKLTSERAGDGAAVAADGGGSAHVVRFSDGMDAVRCYLALNGAVVDPVKYNAAVEQLATIAAGNMDCEEEMKEKLNSLFNPTDFTIANCDKDRGALIFVTVDFFRMGLAPLTPTKCIPPRSSLLTGTSHRGGGAAASRKLSPTAWLAQHLANQAVELAALYPLVASYDSVPWEKFTYAANLAGFLHGTLSVSQYLSLTARLGPNKPITEYEPTMPSIAHEGLQRVNFDVDSLVRLIDTSRSAVEVVKGSRHKPSRRELALKGIGEQLRHPPIVMSIITFLCLIIVGLTILAFAPSLLSGRNIQRF